MHNLFIHPILHRQQGHSFRFALHNTLHKSLVEPSLHCRNTLDSRWQLAVVTGEYHSRCPAHRNPTCCLKRLCRLVYEEGAKFHPVEQTVGTAHKSTCYYPRLPEYLCSDTQVEFYLSLLQSFQFLMERSVTPLSIGTQFTYSLTYSPQLGIIRMRLKPPFVCKRQHLVIHTGRISNAQHINSSVNQFLGYPIHRHITLCAHEHLVLPAQCLENGLDESCGLSCSGRAMHHSHILCPEYLIYCPFLRSIKKWKLHRGERECLCLLTAVEQVAQVAQPTLCPDSAVESLKHQSVCGFVESQLHCQRLCRLQCHNVGSIRHHNHHPVAIHIIHHSRQILS